MHSARIVLIVLLLVPPAAGFAAEKKLWAKSYLNQQAPEFEVEKWLTAQPDTQGKFVLIDFWATWCGPCKKVVPELNAYHEKFGNKLVVIGVSNEKEEKTVREYTEQNIKYFSALAPEGKMNSQYEVTGIPHVVIIDPAGIVRWEGYPLLTDHELTESVIAEILEQPAP